MTAQLSAVCREIVIDSTNNQIVFTENGGGDLTATIAEGTYFLDDSADGLLDAIVTALNAVSVTYTFSGQLQVAPGLTMPSPVSALWCVCWIFATPDPTSGANIVFKWSHASTTFDPKLIGMDLNGSDLTWYDEGSYTRAYSTHAPTPVFVPNAEAPLQDNDDPTPWADVVTHSSPNNVRSHYVSRQAENRKVLSWGVIEHDRVHYKDTGLNFTGEEWGCWRSVWEERTYRGGRIRVYAWDLSNGTSLLEAADLLGTFVFADGPPQSMPVVRTERSQRIYDVGPLVLAPYVTP